MANGKKWTHTFPVRFGDADNTHDFIPRLWAARRVGWLLDEIRLHGENAETKDEVTQLAREYGIVTPFTSYLIVEDETRRNVPSSVRSMPVPVASAPEAGGVYRRFQKSESGAEAVENSRATAALKSMDSVSAGMPQTTILASKPAPASTLAAPSVSTSPSSPVGGSRVKESSDASGPQVRFVGGRSFYFNGKQWVDVRIQKMPQAKPVRLQFNSREYFDFVQKNPLATPWLSLGRNLQIVVQETVYEIYE
jgi:Ca-activated chloride channel family protein